MSELRALLTEQRNPASEGIDAKPTAEMLRIINDEDSLVASAVREAIPAIAKVVDETASRLAAGGRLFYIGAGTSGRLGVLDASECRPTFNVPDGMVQGIIAGGEPALTRATEASEDNPQAGAKDLLDRSFGPGDVLIGIAASGRTPYVLGAIAAARELGAFTAGISCTPDSALARAVEVPVTLIVGPEIVTGSTRMKSGTATKLALNMISTGVMIRLGFVYSNLMVNVQPTNEKLRDRARRIVAEAAGLAPEAAGDALAASGNSVALAIVMSRRNVDLDTARTLLARAAGSVSKALEG